MTISLNYIYILFIIMITFTILLLLLKKGDFLDPAFLMSATMTMSVFFAMLNVKRWDLYVGFNTTIAIVGGIISFAAGGTLCSYFNGPKRDKVCSYFYKGQVYEIKLLYVLLFSSVMLLFLYYSATELYLLSVSLGNTGGYKNMIGIVRPVIEKQQVMLSRWTSYRLLFAQMVTYLYIYIGINNIIYNGFRWKYLATFIPFIIYIPFTILTTGRMALMILVIYIAVIAGVLYQRKYGVDFKSRIRLLGLFSLTMITFFVLFFLIGTFTGKVVNENRTPFIIISHYVGLSVPALDVLLSQQSIISNYIGDNTLLGIYRIINRLGGSLPEVPIFLPFTTFDGIDTNVYTAIGRYIYDFGYTGMAIIMWILGVLYTAFYEKVVMDDTKPVFLILYATYAFPLFLSSIDERFFLDIVGTSFIYTVVLLGILYRLLLVQKS